jgi:hypothetical protein
MFLMYLICGSVDIWYFLTIRATQTIDYMFLMYLICGLVDIKSLIMHKCQMVVFRTGKHLQVYCI